MESSSAVTAQSPLAGRYDTAEDRASAYEHLAGRVTTMADTAPRTVEVRGGSPWQNRNFSF